MIPELHLTQFETSVENACKKVCLSQGIVINSLLHKVKSQ